MSTLEALSYAIDRPTVGWVGFVVVSLVAVAWVAGEVKRRRRVRRWGARR